MANQIGDIKEVLKTMANQRTALNVESAKKFALNIYQLEIFLLK